MAGSRFPQSGPSVEHYPLTGLGKASVHHFTAVEVVGGAVCPMGETEAPVGIECIHNGFDGDGGVDARHPFRSGSLLPRGGLPSQFDQNTFPEDWRRGG